jgi:hypothetical protein
MPKERCKPCERGFRAQIKALKRENRPVSPLLLMTAAIGTGLGIAVGAPVLAVVVAALGGGASLAIWVGEHRDRNNPALRGSSHEVRELREAFLAERSRLLGSAE